jgi:hypothetical protein
MFSVKCNSVHSASDAKGVMFLFIYRLDQRRAVVLRIKALSFENRFKKIFVQKYDQYDGYDQADNQKRNQNLFVSGPDPSDDYSSPALVLLFLLFLFHILKTSASIQ